MSVRMTWRLGRREPELRSASGGLTVAIHHHSNFLPRLRNAATDIYVYSLYSTRAYFGGAMVPHSLHFLRFSSVIHASMYGLS